MNESANTGIHDTEQQPYFLEYTHNIFKRLDPQDVEQFYKNYQFWLLQQRAEMLQVEIKALDQAVSDNDEQLQRVRPSAIALANLAQLQASGVEDIDLLDRMLARGEDWLDYTMQLLRHCEEMDVIGGDYTQWCGHALEGAYDWIASMNGKEEGSESGAEFSTLVDNQGTDLEEATEEQLLQKLMSEDEATEKLPAIGRQVKQTQQVPVAEAAMDEDIEKQDQVVAIADERVEQPVAENVSTVEEVTPLVETPAVNKEIEVAEIPLADEQIKVEDIVTDSPETAIEESVHTELNADPEGEQTQEDGDGPTVKISALAGAKITRELTLAPEQIEVPEPAEDSTQLEEPTNEITSEVAEEAIVSPDEASAPPDEQVETVIETDAQAEETPADENSSVVESVESSTVEPTEEIVDAAPLPQESTSALPQEETTSTPVSTTVQKQEATQHHPTVRKGGLWNFLLRLLAKIWRK